MRIRNNWSLNSNQIRYKPSIWHPIPFNIWFSEDNNLQKRIEASITKRFFPTKLYFAKYWHEWDSLIDLGQTKNAFYTLFYHFQKKEEFFYESNWQPVSSKRKFFQQEKRGKNPIKMDSVQGRFFCIFNSFRILMTALFLRNM